MIDHSNEHFGFQNDFNSRTNLKNREALLHFDIDPNNNLFFINGFPPARISFIAIRRTLEGLLMKISKQNNWSFRSPKNIFESANRLKMSFSVVGEMFKMSDYEALFVGGETQVYLIPAPTDLKKK